MMRTGRGSTLALLALAAACASAPPRAPQTAECREFFAGLDERVEDAGVRDEGAFRVPGYPYLRTDRFLASFAGEATRPAEFGAWVERLRGHDADARTAELQNLGASDRDALMERVERCGRLLISLELSGEQERRALRSRVAAPDDYSMLARTFGFYPVAVPFLNLGIRDYNEEVREDYARRVEDLDSPGSLVAWRPPQGYVSEETVARWIRDAPGDGLGIPQLEPEQWAALARLHAPVWWIETGGPYDRPGVPLPGARFDGSRAVTYFHGSFTRFGERVLPALVYVVWFSERPPDGVIDSYAGALDGVIWRVTLDAAGKPLAYDTIHSCGCYRYYYPVQPLRRLPRGGFWQEPVLFPQAEVPAGPVALRIQSRTHYVRRVVAADAPAAESHRYELVPYAALLALPDGRGGTASLFGDCGLVDGTERLERFWLWPAGVPSPGAMRQWGRHATSFVGRSHFDDPRWLEQVFEVPPWARAPGL